MTSVAPAHRAAPQMTHTPDPVAPPQAQAIDDAVAEVPARPRLRDQVAENPLLSLVVGLTLALFTFLGTVVVALLVFALNNFNDRFDVLEARMDRLEEKVEAGFAAQGAKIAELDARLTAQIAELDARLTAQIADLDRKFTALIAHLNATAAVDAALEHRLLIPDADATEPESGSPG